MAGPQSQAFKPGASAKITVTGTTARVILDFDGESPPYQVRVVADGTDNVYISFGDSTVTATATDIYMLTGTIEVFAVPPSTTYIAALADGSSAELYITAGNGM